MKNITFRKIKSRSILLLLFFCFYFYDGVYAQCPTEISASPTSPSAIQEDVTFSLSNAQGGFNMDAIPGGWSQIYGTAGVHSNSECKPSYDGGNFYWVGESLTGPDYRDIISTSYDFSGSGAMITFYMKFAGGGDSGSNCETLDPNEGIELQYNTGSGWVPFADFDPNDGTGNDYVNWNQYEVYLPAVARTASTQIRWHQKLTSGATNDYWGLDDIRFYKDVQWTIDGAPVTIGAGETPFSFQETFTTPGVKNIVVSGTVFNFDGSECSFASSMQYTAVQPSVTTTVTSSGDSSIGDTAMMALNVQNTSTVTISGVDVALTFGDDLAPDFTGMPNITLGNPATVNVPDILPGDTYVLNIPVFLKEPSDANSNGDYYDDNSFDVNVQTTQTTYGISNSFVHEFSAKYTDIEFNVTAFTDGSPTADYQVTFEIQNNGSHNATELYANLFVPSGFDYVSSSPDAGTSYNGVWTIGALNPSNSVAITLFLDRNLSGNYQILGEAFLKQHDWDYANNAVSAELPPIVDLQGDVSFLEPVPTTTYYGQEIDLIVSVTNQGNADSGIITVDELVPDGYDIVAYNFLDGTYDSSTDKWDNFILEAGENQLIELKLKIKTDTGSLDYSPNTFGSDSNGNNINFGIMPNISPTAASDLDMTFTVSNQNPEVGEHVEITVTLTNNGPSNSLASNIIVDFGKGNGLGYTPATPNLAIWIVPTLNSGDSETETFILEALGLPNGTAPVDYYDFWAEILSAPNPDLDSDFLNNPGSPPTSGTDPAANVEDDFILTTFTPVPVANMDITITDNKELYTAGNTNTYDVRIQNTGLSEAENVTITFNDFSPIGSSEIDYSGSIVEVADVSNIFLLGTTPMTFDNGTDISDGFTINGMTFPAGSVLDLQVTISIPSNYTIEAGNTPNITIETSVTTTTLEQDTNNNVAFDTNLPDSTVDIDLAMEIYDGSLVNPPVPAVASNVNVGDIVFIYIESTNNGPSDASGVQVSDMLPDGYAYLAHLADSGTSYDPTTGVWTINDLVDSDTKYLEIEATITSTQNYLNVAEVINVDQTDSDLTDNVVSKSVNLIVTDLEVTLDDGDDTYTAGETKTYRLVIENKGPATAENVTIKFEDLTPIYSSINEITDISNVYDVANPPIEDLNGNPSPPALIDDGFVISGLTFPPGAILELDVVLDIPSDFTDGAPLEVLVQVTTDTYDTDMGNNDAFDVDLPNLISDLQITMDDPVLVGGGAPTFVPGENLEYTVTVRNDGNSDASNVNVQFPVPSGFQYISEVFESFNGAVWIPFTPLAPEGYDEATGVWTIGDLAFDEEVRITLRLEMLASGNYMNVATVSGSETDDVPGNNQASKGISLADVVVEILDISDNPINDNVQTFIPGQDFVYKVRVTNQLSFGGTPTFAQNIKVLAPLPINTSSSDVSWTRDGGPTNAGMLDDTITSLTNNPAGNANRVEYTVTISTPSGMDGNLIQWLEASTASVDLSPLCNVGACSFTATPDPDVELEIESYTSDMSATTNVGDEVEFTIEVENTGVSDAFDVSVTNILSSQYEFVSYTTDQGVYDTNSNTWFVGDLASNTPITNNNILTLKIKAIILPTGPPYTNTITIETNPLYSTDNPADNTATFTPPVGVPIPSSDLEISLEVNNDEPEVGDNVTFTLTVVNNGPSVAQNVTISSVLGVGLPLVNSQSATIGTPSLATTNSADDSVVWLITSLPVGTPQTLTFDSNVLATGPYDIISQVSSMDDNDPDSTPGNAGTDPDEDDSVAMVLKPKKVDLQLISSVFSQDPTAGDEVTVTLTLTNNGPNNASQVEVLVPIPDGLEYVSDNSGGLLKDLLLADLSTPGTDNILDTWEVGNLQKNTTTSIDIVFMVLPDEAGSYGFTSVADAFEYNTGGTGSQTTVTFNTVSQLANMTISLTDNKDTYTAGIPNSYNLIIENLGPSSATELQLAVNVPLGTTTSNWQVDDNSTNLTNSDIGDLILGNTISGVDFESGGVLELSFELDIPSSYTVTNASSPDIEVETFITGLPGVLAQTTDLDTANPIADLEITKDVSDPLAVVGTNVVFTIDVENFGPSDASGILVEDLLPSGYVYVSDNGGGDYDSGTGIWNVGNIANTGVATLEITATVQATGEFNNVTEIVFLNETDPDWTNNVVNDVISPQPDVDLSVNLTVNNTSPYAGDELTINVEIVNNGLSTATGVQVLDIVRPGYTYINDTPSAGFWDNTLQIWNVGNLPSGQSEVLTFNVLVNGDQGIADQYDICATIDSNEHDVNEQCITLIPVQNATLKTTVTDNKTKYTAGTGFTGSPSQNENIYRIEVENEGPSPTSNVLINIKIPFGTQLEYLDVVTAETTVDITGLTSLPVTSFSVSNLPDDIDSIDLDVATLGGALSFDPGEKIVIEARMAINSNFTIVNAASPNLDVTVEATGSVTNLEPNKAIHTDTDHPDPISDLEITKVSSIDDPEVGDLVTFTLEVTNNGPSDADGILVEELLPDGYTYVTYTGSGYDPLTGIWNIGGLANGDAIAIDIDATVNASGNYSNVTAIVALNQTDPDLTNNIVEDDTSPIPVVDLELLMEVNNDEPNVGEEVVFTLTLLNGGPSTATGIEIENYLPNGYTYVSANPSMGIFIPDDNDGDNTDQDDYWIILALQKDATATLTITAIVNDGNAAGSAIDYNNCAEIVSVNEDDPDSTPDNGIIGEDDDVCSSTTPVQISDLKVQMDDGLVVYTAGTQIEYGIMVKNDGPSTAQAVRVINNAPTESNIVSWQISGFVGTPTLPIPDNGTGNIDVFIEDLKPGEEVFFDVVLFLDSDFTTTRLANGDSPLLVNITTVELYDTPTGSAIPGDLDESNNVAIEEDYPNPISNLEIVKQVFDGPQSGTPNPITEAEVGSDVYFLIEVANPTPSDITQFPDVLEGGPSDATGVIAYDLLPTGYTYVGHLTDGVSYDNATGLFNVGDLAVGETRFVEIQATVNPEGEYTNITEITSLDQTDPNWVNNTTEVGIDPIPVVDLNVLKTVNNLTPYVGDNVVFTITAFNAGPSPATEVQLEDLLPSGFTIVSTAPSVGQFDTTTNVWLFDILPANNTAVMTITAKVEKTTGTVDEYENCVTITSDEDNTLPLLESCVTLVPIQVADLAIFKEVDNLIPDVGDEVIFTIKLVNDGPSDATDVVVSDLLPAGFDYVSHTQTNGTYDDTTGNWSITSVPYDEVSGPTIETLTITAIVTPDQTQQEYTNCTEIVASNEFDPDSDPNNGNQDPLEDDYACVEVFPTQVVDVSIVKEVDNLTPNVGMNVFFTLTVTNDGPSMATGLVVTDLLESGFDFVASNPSVGTYNEYTGSWDIGILAADASVTLVIEATVNPKGSYLNCSAITGLNEKDIDSTINNNSDFEDDESCVIDIVPVPQVDLFILKTVNNETPYVGDNVVFNIVIANEGPSDATAVIVTDLLPDGYEYVSHDASVGVYDPETGEWIVGIIPAGESEGFSVTAEVLPINNVVDEYVNCAVITNVFEEDTDPSNDESCAETYPIRGADISLNKTVNNLTPMSGSEITFTVEVKNDGPSDANNLQIYDYIESGFRFIEASATNGTYNENTGIWNIDTIENDETALLFVKVEVLPTGSHENIAEVVFVDEFDFDSTPNNGDVFEDDYAKVIIEPQIDLEIPDGFSPNGDGINDVFEIKNLEVLYPNFSYEIYNRYGNKIYEYAHNGNPDQKPRWWDGYYDGDFSLDSNETLPASTYFYIINFNNDNRKPQTGWVYLNK
ncbi:gliding motility-associated C-terminal domain-containing protein [Aureivirga sp. CE67]|uniref:T9SS type B sorting domain-containing protein n=1 Tax=Aureivirga sp. CE67 TaxID=1788983 RepID=UPI0018C99D65|nr:gliding motility-associated C-terminal domain-containing protein [Aureivirga sp. CE67]